MRKSLRGWGTVLTWAAVLLGNSFVTAVAPEETVPPVLVVSARAGTPDIYLLESTGIPRNLTNNKATNAYPAWSPDRRKIAFSSDRDGSIQIYVMDADGGHVRALTKGPEISRSPAWSPDGTKIAFCRDTAEGARIFVMEADGSHAKQINEGSGWDPAWSPDGKRLLFASARAGNGFRVCLMDADGSHYCELSTNNNAVGFVYPSWSPDGSKIAWADTVGDGGAGAMELFVADSDGKHVRQLTKLGHMNVYPAWSADGKRMVFYHADSEQSGSYYSVSADGSEPRVLLKDVAPIEGGRPACQPRPAGGE